MKTKVNLLITVLLTAILITATFLIACSSNSENSDGKEVQLTYQDWNTDWFVGMAQEMMVKFNESHPDFQVYYLLDPENY